MKDGGWKPIYGHGFAKAIPRKGLRINSNGKHILIFASQIKKMSLKYFHIF